MKRIAIAVILGAVLLPVAGRLMAQEPCDGDPIQVLNADPCKLSKWIDIKDSVTICQALCILEYPEDPQEKCGIYPSWIGGTVVADENAEDGFYFEPETVRIAEIVIEIYQTTTCAIAEDPKGFNGGTWFVPCNLVEKR